VLVPTDLGMTAIRSAGMEAIVKGCGQTNLTVNENTERMKALLTKVESYFGDSAGLEFEN
jgi:hypothetical protein